MTFDLQKVYNEIQSETNNSINNHLVNESIGIVIHMFEVAAFDGNDIMVISSNNNKTVNFQNSLFLNLDIYLN